MPGDRVLRASRWLAASIVPFLVVAFYPLYLRPTMTRELFAWAIQPTMTAMTLGAVYIGGAYFFFRAWLARRWHHIRLGFPPVATFASYLAVATILHWDRFTHGHIAFILWAGLYFTTPFLVLAAWLRNEREDPGARADSGQMLPRPIRVAFAIGGVAALLVSLGFLLQPEVMAGFWPWALTPLTARVVGAIVALGSAGLWIGLEPRWTAMPVVFQTGIFMLVMIGVAAARAWRTELAPGAPGSVAFLAVLAVTLAVVAATYAVMERRRRAEPPLRENPRGSPAGVSRA
jgi:hypothetical protein